jgi:GNAT superfamily N-acetyltransferase
MELRVAKPEDFDIVYDMALKFINQTVYKEYLNEEVFKPLVKTFVEGSPDSIGIVAMDGDKPVGMIGGMVNYFIFGGVKLCSEVAWWVEPEYRKTGVGKDLIDALEYWAKNIDCRFVTLSALDKDYLPKFYEKIGYDFAEISYMKKV